MFDSFKKLGSGLLSTAKNSFEFAQGKTTLMKAYYNLGEKVVKDFQNGTLKVSKEMEEEINNLIKVIEETNSSTIVDKDILEGINEIKKEVASKKEAEPEVKTEEEVVVEPEVKTEEVKKTTKTKVTKSKTTKDTDK